MTGHIHVGTSGWQYKHWKDVFYPPGMPSRDWLSFYVRHLDTIELNVTFYRGISNGTYGKWRDSVPPGFLFSAKMSRFITHIKRLRVDEESVSRFVDGVKILAQHLGVILIQLPPSLTYDRALVTHFFDLLDPSLKYAVEARNGTFLADEFLDILHARNMAWCISESAGRYPYREALTADFVYLRLHGREKLYGSSYTDAELKELAKRIRGWGRQAFIYFDNDFEGFAVKNALSLKQMFLANPA